MQSPKHIGSVELEDKINILIASGKLEEARQMMHKLGRLKNEEANLCKIDDPSCESCQ